MARVWFVAALLICILAVIVQLEGCGSCEVKYKNVKCKFDLDSSECCNSVREDRENPNKNACPDKDMETLKCLTEPGTEGSCCEDIDMSP
mmetsp:Transcript_36943/g.69064  ORF Transcript_36943/g.69064 Transcript_36943/m.69064 type:complete len:90 (-) Transcript_36943:31-300(-)